ncbi:hypothetical protein GCM10027287_40170 [Bordetella muralis]
MPAQIVSIDQFTRYRQDLLAAGRAHSAVCFAYQQCISVQRFKGKIVLLHVSLRFGIRRNCLDPKESCRSARGHRVARRLQAASACMRAALEPENGMAHWEEIRPPPTLTGFEASAGRHAAGVRR